MAVAVESLGLRERTHFQIISGGKETWGQVPLLSDLPWGTARSLYTPESYSRMIPKTTAVPAAPAAEVAEQRLLPHLGRSMVEPDEYHKEYLTDSGSAYYATAIRYDPESGYMEPTGRNTIVASGEIHDATGEVIEQTTVQVGYENWEAVYIAVNRQDVRLLEEFYRVDPKDRADHLPMISEIAQFSGPFGEERLPPVSGSVVGESVYLSGSQLILEKEDERGVSSVAIPFHLDAAIYPRLRKEGKSGQAEDSDEAFLQPSELYEALSPDMHTNYQVPQQYPVIFSYHGCDQHESQP